MAASGEPTARKLCAGSLQYIGGATAAAAARFGHTAALGFDHVVVSPPWTAAPRSNGFLTVSFDAADPAWDLATLVAAGKAARLGVIMDVVLDRVAADNALVQEPHSPFMAPSNDALLDPRRAVDAGAAEARLDSAGDCLALAAWWGPRLAAWHSAGLAGFRLIGLDAIPDAFLPGFVAALRQALPRAILLGWTPGMRRSALAALSAGCADVLDGVFVSLPWWDWSSSWLWDEVAALAQVAAVYGVNQIPPGPRDQQTSILADARATGLAATLGAGWMHVAPSAADAEEDELATSLNAARRNGAALASPFAPLLPLGDSGAILALLRFDGPDHRSAQRAALVVINTDRTRRLPIAGSALLPSAGGAFERFQSADGEGLTPASVLELPPGDVRIFFAQARSLVAPAAAPLAKSARFAAEHWTRLAIELPTPCVDGGAFPVKRIAGEVVSVEADIIFDGHDKIAAAVKWIGPGDTAWHEVPMRALANDRWQASFPIEAIGRHAYVVQAWRDRYETFRDELAKKSAASVPISLEVIEGERLIQAAKTRGNPALQDALKQIAVVDEAHKVQVLLDPLLAKQMADADDRPFLVQSAEIPVDAERIGAGFASWYEVFPRSMSDDAKRHGTFVDVQRHLPRIRDMGFDVLYFPPIHPIGRVNRKGPNNTLTPSETDPGSPYAIGSMEGGHDALHPQLGSFEDFQHLRHQAVLHGLEIAIDFAVQCAPDHPWLKQHKGWFDWRPDGSIRYAENPPKKYQDIVNVDFYAGDAVPELWTALCDVVLFWAGQGIRLFRVDNPHTKPFPFWQWLIGEVRQQYPDAVFLAEAFTRPKVMYRLAKVGFSQSYTYFTWRNSKTELEAYLTELDQEAPRDFFRPHFFVNTPDINPLFLQTSGRPGFLIRAALAATLSGLWGVYNGFELCEATPLVPGKEEYIDSEKYQLRAWDWDRPGNIVAEITALNRIRKQNPALQSHRGVTFHTAHNELVLLYEKATADRSNVLLVAVCLDPFQAQEADFEVPLWAWGLPDEASVAVEDLLTGSHFIWTGKYHHLRLTPDQPYAIWRLRPVI